MTPPRRRAKGAACATNLRALVLGASLTLAPGCGSRDGFIDDYVVDVAQGFDASADLALDETTTDDALTADMPTTEPPSIDVSPPPDLPELPDNPPPADAADASDVLPREDLPPTDGADVSVTSDVITEGRCAGAIELLPGVTLSGQNTRLAEEAPSSCPSFSARPLSSLWYRVTVPATTQLNVSTVGGGGFGATQIRVLTACDARSCLAATSLSLDGRTTTARWFNPATTDQTVIIAVAPTSSASPLEFAIRATFSTPPRNNTCARAAEVVDGTTLRMQDLSAATTALPPCSGTSGSTGGALFYTVSVPAGHTLTASATPSGVARGNTYLRVMPSCEVSACLATSSSFAGAASTSWTNVGVAARRVIVAVHASSMSSAGPVDLMVRVRPPPTNVSCMTPARLASGVAVVGEDLSLARDRARGCMGTMGPTGPALFYVVRVNAGERVTVLARRTSSGFFTPVLRLAGACNADACLSQSSSALGSDAASASWINSSGAPRDVYVTASSNTSSADGRYDITATTSATPYRVEAVPRVCDDMSAATVERAASGDDTGAPSRALPFAFQYFRSPVLAWSASTNGFAQLWATRGMSTGAYTSLDLPSPSAPSGMLAAFWDDLEVSVEGSVRYMDLPGPTRHFTVEWSRVHFCCGGTMPPDRLTFQIKLFERTNVIEFHYCALASSTRASGSNATVGIQNAAGSSGVVWSFRRAGAVTSTTGLRFTPMM